jgi:putative membrane protein
MSEGDTGSSKPAAGPTAVTARPTFKQALRDAFASWWGNGPGDRPKQSPGELAEDRTDMAGMRSLMAADRTLMAWVRTSLSMSSFGFTIYKVLQGFAEAGLHLPHHQTPLVVGLFLTGLGTLAMVMGSVEYAQSVRYLRQFMDIKLARPAFIMAILMGLVGLFLFVSIITKVF